MTEQHPITPPPELVRQWIMEETDPYEPNWQLYEEGIATRAAQWGADMELEACCEWISSPDTMHMGPSDLRATRRPKPPSLKEQALIGLSRIEQTGDFFSDEMKDLDIIRRALEALPDA